MRLGRRRGCVGIIASGETERRALPHLAAHLLQAEDLAVEEVRIPPGHKALNVEMAEKLVKAAWYEKAASPPDKFVLHVDGDGRAPEEVLRPFRDELPRRIGPNIRAAVQFAYAQWRLEAWCFADANALREYLGRALGSVDPSRPEEIPNPKLHLKHLLGDRVYTAVVSEEIAKRLDARVIAQRSTSFCGFLEALRNGDAGRQTEAGG